jgi:preprotein translocase subunit SecD
MNRRNQLFVFALIASLGAFSSPSVSQPQKPSIKQQSGVQITLQAKLNPEKGLKAITPQMMERAKLVLENRLNGLRISKASVEIVANNQLVVKLPNVRHPTQAKRIIGTNGQLDFRKQKKGTENELRERLQIQETLIVQREALKKSGSQKAIASNKAAYKKSLEDLKDVFESPELSGDMIKDAVASQIDRNSSSWQIVLTFDEKGADLFAKTTGEIAGTGRVLGIFLDGELISFPSVGPEFQGKGITGGRAVITGRFTLDSATDLALQIKSGALPILLEIVDSHSF